MGLVVNKAEVSRGLEPVAQMTTPYVRQVFAQFEEMCPTPAIWERAFYELLGCFASAEACSKAFNAMDTDNNGLVDARELMGSLAIVSRGHLNDRMTLLFDIFDHNRENDMSSDECFLMMRRTVGGLKKMVGLMPPSEKVINTMVKQVWKQANKEKHERITPEDWKIWWMKDGTARGALKLFTWSSAEHRGLPTPGQWVTIDYAKGSEDAMETALKKGAENRFAGQDSRRRSRRTSMEDETRPSKGSVASESA